MDKKHTRKNSQKKDGKILKYCFKENGTKQFNLN